MINRLLTFTIAAACLAGSAATDDDGAETGEGLDELGMKPKVWFTFDGDFRSKGTASPNWDGKSCRQPTWVASRSGTKGALEISAACRPVAYDLKAGGSWTILTTAKCGSDPNALLWALGSARGRGTRITGFGYNGHGGVRLSTWWGREETSKMTLMRDIVHFDRQFHQFAIVCHGDGKAELYVDGKCAGHADAFEGGDPGGELTFGSVHWHGGAKPGGFSLGNGAAIDDFRYYEDALTEQQLLQISNANRPWPEGLPRPRRALSSFIDTNALLRCGYEIPDDLVIGTGGEKRLYAKGVLAQCGIGAPKSFELTTGGLLAIGSQGFTFDSNYAGGKTNLMTFSGGAVAAYEKSFIRSAAPIQLSGTVRIVTRGKLLVKSAFAGTGNIVKSGKDVLGLQYPCERATGRLTVQDGELVLGPAASWAGTIELKAGTVLRCASRDAVGKLVAAHTAKVVEFGTARRGDLSADVFPQPATAYDYRRIQREKLGRGTYAWRLREDAVRIGWRYLSGDPTNAAFNVYCDGRKITERPVSSVTYFDHVGAWDGRAHKYAVRPVESSNRTGFFTLPAAAKVGYMDIELVPPKPEQPPGRPEAFAYTPNDCSIGDVDGDGAYELIVKWEAAAADNAHWGCTSPTWLEAVRLDGTSRSLWKICLGPNVRAGAHYSPFMVYDFDGDGKAEVMCRTAPGAVDGQGRTLTVADGSRTENFAWKRGGAFKDWRTEDCHVVFAPNFLTVFAGLTGAAVDTVPFKPDVLDNPQEIEKKNTWLVNRTWGSRNPGNQAFRMLAAVAYLDGIRPSAVFCRGYYSRTFLTAWDFDGRKLSERWMFSTDDSRNWGYNGQGFHNIRVADVDFDGRDEILYGHMCVDHTGEGLWTTGYGHGDSQRLIQASPTTRGLQLWTCHEACPYGVSLIDAQTGRTLLRRHGPMDTGSCNALDVDARQPGVELFSGTHCGIFAAATQRQYMGPKPRPKSNYYAMLRWNVWWLGDLTKSAWCGDNTVVRYGIRERHIFEEWSGRGDVTSNNSTKGDPCLTADVFGDWREEIFVRRTDNRGIRVFATPKDTPWRFHTFLEDPVYRISVATENVGYNIPTDTGFYFGPDLLGHDIWFRGTHL